MKKFIFVSLIIFLLVIYMNPLFSNSNPKPPSKVKIVKIELVGVKVRIEWKKAIPGDYEIAGYEIFRGEDINNLHSIGKVKENITSFVDYNVYLNKTYYYCVKAFDSMNNYSEPSDTVSITVVDKIPPDLVILEPEDNNFFTKEDEIDLLVGVRDYESGLKDLKVNGEKINRCGCSTFRKTLKLKEGENRFIIEAVDHAGNRTRKILTVYKDTTPPDIKVSIPKMVNNENLVIKGRVLDNLSKVKYVRVNGINVEIDKDGNFETIILLNEGKNKIVIDTSDNLNNETREIYEVYYENTIEIKIFIDRRYFYVNNRLGKMDVPPIIVDGRSFVPIRFIIEGIGGNVIWNKAERGVSIKYKDKEVKLWIGRETALVNGKEVKIDKDLNIKPFIIKGRCMIPIRFIGETLGFSVLWNPSDRSVILKYP